MFTNKAVLQHFFGLLYFVVLSFFLFLSFFLSRLKKQDHFQ